MTLVFKIGRAYTRQDIYKTLNVPEEKRRGNWETGYHQYNGECFLFPNVGSVARTGHDYDNRWEDGDLIWWGKTQSKLQHPSIQSMLDSSATVHIFARADDRGPFVYHGQGVALEFQDSSPVMIKWAFKSELGHMPSLTTEEILAPEKYYEGAMKKVAVNVYERDKQARTKCIEHYGAVCVVCNFDFHNVYGSLGTGFIHVHHLKPLSEIKKGYSVDPIADLRPVCPNCHAMIHRVSPALDVAVLRKAIGR